MAWQAREGMDEYLKPTELCDCDNESVKDKAQELIKGAETSKEAAIRIFHFVRDGILYGADVVDAKASDTLKRRVGFCMSKANLQIAFLRAVGIPARYHRAGVKKDALRGLVLNIVYRNLPDTLWIHCWCECYPSQTWLSCEAVLDEALYRGAIGKGLYTREQIPTIDWDGGSDLIMMTHWLVKDYGTSASLDDILKKAQRDSLLPKFVTHVMLPLNNRLVTDKVRKKGK